MSYENALECITLVAAGTIPQYGVVSLDTSGTIVVTPLAGTSALIVGVAQSAAVTGDAVQVAISGATKVLAAGTFTPGVEVAVGATDGAVITRGGSNAKLVIGVALEAGVAAKWSTVLLNIGRAIAVG